MALTLAGSSHSEFRSPRGAHSPVREINMGAPQRAGVAQERAGVVQVGHQGALLTTIRSLVQS